jgi:hypothetical protein
MVNNGMIYNEGAINEGLSFNDSAEYDIPPSSVGAPIEDIKVSDGAASVRMTPRFYIAQGLPDGLTVNRITGIISGTPKTACPAGTATLSVTYNVTPAKYGSITVNYGEVSWPPINGTLSALAVDAATGKLTATLSGGSGTYIYTWSVAGQSSANGTANGREYTPAASELGKIITCTVTKSGTTGELTKSETVYKAQISLSGNAKGDSATIANAYGKAGDMINIAYMVGTSGTAANSVAFTGGEVVDSGVSPAAYAISTANAVSGVITITATFTHVNLPATTVIKTVTLGTNNVTVDLIRPQTGSAVLIVAVYNSSNKLLAVKAQDITESGENTVTGITLPTMESITVKAMMWESPGSAFPLCKTMSVVRKSTK